MFRLLIVKLQSGQRLKITDIGHEQTLTGNQLVAQKGSSYSHANCTVNINLNVYHHSGVGIPGRKYYLLTRAGL
ncbi:MAG: hypothetical protein LBB34_02280 [Holosporales bacterium]|nr:hypothetical protein [Holosporales bacterium]